LLKNDLQEARRLERRSSSVQLQSNGKFADGLIRAIREGGIDAVVTRQSLATFGSDAGGVKTSWVDDVEHQVRCQVFLAAEIT
jgi:hypothetical protein